MHTLHIPSKGQDTNRMIVHIWVRPRSQGLYRELQWITLIGITFLIM